MAPKGVLQELSQNKTIVNPYKQKPTYKDNRATWVPERDIRPPQDVPYMPPPMPGFERRPWPFFDIHVSNDRALGHLGGAEIDFGTGKEDKEGNNKSSTNMADV